MLNLSSQYAVWTGVLPSEPFLCIDPKPSQIAAMRSSRLGINEHLPSSIGQHKGRVLLQPLNDVYMQAWVLLSNTKKSILERVGELIPQVHVFSVNHVSESPLGCPRYGRTLADDGWMPARSELNTG